MYASMHGWSSPPLLSSIKWMAVFEYNVQLHHTRNHVLLSWLKFQNQEMTGKLKFLLQPFLILFTFRLHWNTAVETFVILHPRHVLCTLI